MHISNKYTWYPFKLVHSKQIDSLINFCSNIIKPSRLINSDTQRQASRVYSKLIAPLYLSLSIYSTFSLWYIYIYIYTLFFNISTIWKIDSFVIIYSFAFVIKFKRMKRILLIFKLSYFNDFIDYLKIFYILFPNIHFENSSIQEEKRIQIH